MRISQRSFGRRILIHFERIPEQVRLLVKHVRELDFLAIRVAAVDSISTAASWGSFQTASSVGLVLFSSSSLLRILSRKDVLKESLPPEDVAPELLLELGICDCCRLAEFGIGK